MSTLSRQPAMPKAVEEALARSDVAELRTLSGLPEKEISKAAKRALHLLRSRGIAVPEPAANPAVAEPSRTAANEAHEPARVTTIDSSGERALFLPLKARLGFTLHWAVLSEERGIVSLSSEELSRKQVRSFAAELPSETREILREISLARASALIADALALGAIGAVAARASELLRSLPPPDPSPEPPAEPLAEPPALSANAETALRESASLFETPVFRGYLPPRETLLQVGQQLEEVMLSPLLIDESQRLTQLHHALERAEAEYFRRPRRDLYGARLLDAAELFAARRDPIDAERARATAAALRSERPIHEIPFARSFFERIFDLQAAARARAAQPPDVPPAGGGLILP